MSNAANKFKSPLYWYTEAELKAIGKGKLGVHNVQQAYDSITTLITNCCVLGFPKTKSAFLKGFYALLKLMNLPHDIHKAKAVQKLLADNIACCA